MIVFDTNVVSAIMRPHLNPSVFAWSLTIPVHERYGASIVFAEILGGATLLPHGKRKIQLIESAHAIFEAYGPRVFSFETRTAYIYADIVGERRALGRPISVQDAMIAAICRQHGATLATRNVRDFLHLDIPLINPWDVMEITTTP